jgi:hypothetical protein
VSVVVDAAADVPPPAAVSVNVAYLMTFRPKSCCTPEIRWSSV